LTGAADYQRVFKRAVRFSSPGFTILIRVNQLTHPRLGLIVSKKCARKAVQRNRIKRQIRESFRQYWTTLGNVDIVVMAKTGLAEKPNWDIRNSLLKHWTEIGRCAS